MEDSFGRLFFNNSSILYKSSFKSGDSVVKVLLLGGEVGSFFFPSGGFIIFPSFISLLGSGDLVFKGGEETRDFSEESWVG